jgi:hypothetical protein
MRRIAAAVAVCTVAIAGIATAASPVDTGKAPLHVYGGAWPTGHVQGVAVDTRNGYVYWSFTQMLAYGIYSNTTRQDDDHQVVLEYDVGKWRRLERPLTQSDPHRSGPATYDGKYFVYTGNTTYGVQNLEYDAYTGNWMMAIYRGRKAEFPNYSFFIVDGSREPGEGIVRGQQTGLTLEHRPEHVALAVLEGLG